MCPYLIMTHPLMVCNRDRPLFYILYMSKHTANYKLLPYNYFLSGFIIYFY